MSDLNKKKRVLTSSEINRAVIALLDITSVRTDIQVALAGGVALQAYGSPRATTDVDFVSNWTLGPQRTFRIDHPLSFGGLSYVLDPGGITVDLIVRNDAYKPLYDEALMTAGNQNGVPIILPDYLAAMKFAADREKDRIDLAWLLGAENLVDVAHVGDILYRTLGHAMRDRWSKVSSRMLLAISRYKRKSN
jgi:hypothetical protein